MIEKTWPIAEQLLLNILTTTQQLHQQLAQEADILKAGQPSELIDQSTAQKKQLAQQLEQLHAQLSQLLTSAKLPNNPEGILLYLQQAETAALPATAETLANWRQIQQLCAACKNLNEQNGASIDLLSQHAKRSLDILKGKTQAANTYSRDGATQTESLTHTLTYYL
jgi:flagellar biosynthesis protein FlgN